jgi:hypothetical protein
MPVVASGLIALWFGLELWGTGYACAPAHTGRCLAAAWILLAVAASAHLLGRIRGSGAGGPSVLAASLAMALWAGGVLWLIWSAYPTSPEDRLARLFAESKSPPDPRTFRVAVLELLGSYGSDPERIPGQHLFSASAYRQSALHEPAAGLILSYAAVTGLLDARTTAEVLATFPRAIERVARDRGPEAAEQAVRDLLWRPILPGAGAGAGTGIPATPPASGSPDDGPRRRLADLAARRDWWSKADQHVAMARALVELDRGPDASLELSIALGLRPDASSTEEVRTLRSSLRNAADHRLSRCRSMAVAMQQTRAMHLAVEALLCAPDCISPAEQVLRHNLEAWLASRRDALMRVETADRVGRLLAGSDEFQAEPWLVATEQMSISRAFVALGRSTDGRRVLASIDPRFQTPYSRWKAQALDRAWSSTEVSR